MSPLAIITSHHEPLSASDAWVDRELLGRSVLAIMSHHWLPIGNEMNPRLGASQEWFSDHGQARLVSTVVIRLAAVAKTNTWSTLISPSC